MSDVLDKLLLHLKENNHKITQIRISILEVLTEKNKPLSIHEFTNELKLKNLSPNKTTFYREIEFLKTNNIINEIEFGDGKKRYELKTEHCHHHLICNSCKSVQCINLENEVHEITANVESRFNFKVIEHMLEFFGVCNLCSNKGKLAWK